MTTGCSVCGTRDAADGCEYCGKCARAVLAALRKYVSAWETWEQVRSSSERIRDAAWKELIDAQDAVAALGAKGNTP